VQFEFVGRDAEFGGDFGDGAEDGFLEGGDGVEGSHRR
jgi:hypothetical protein